MMISLFACLVTFSRQYYFCRSYFFTASGNYFDTTITFSEQLFLRSSCFFEELCFFEEISLQNQKKWLISCSYNPKTTSLSNHIAALTKGLDLFTTKYERSLSLGDFNAGMEDSSMKIFCNNHDLTSMYYK